MGEISWFQTNSTPYMRPNQKVEQKTNWLKSQKYFEFSSPVFQVFCEGFFLFKMHTSHSNQQENNEF